MAANRNFELLTTVRRLLQNRLLCGRGGKLNDMTDIKINKEKFSQAFKAKYTYMAGDGCRMETNTKVPDAVINWMIIQMEAYGKKVADKQREACSLWCENSVVMDCPLVTDDSHAA